MSCVLQRTPWCGIQEEKIKRSKKDTTCVFPMPQIRVSNAQQKKLSVQHLLATTRGGCVDADMMFYIDFVMFCMYVK